MRIQTTIHFLILVLAVVVLGGCAGTPARETRILYPPLPDQPRVEYLEVFYSQDNFPKTGFQIFKEGFLGKPPLNFFNRPYGIVADGKGKVYVSDSIEGKVKVFDLNARTLNLMTKQPFGTPLGLAIDRDGRIYVADAKGGVVLVFSPDHRPLFAFGRDVIEVPGFVAINEELGRIYVTDGRGHQVGVFDMEGKHLFSFGEIGDDDGQLYGPQGVAVDREGRVFVAEQWNARISVFDADGNFLHRFGERGDQQGQLEFPKGVAISSDGSVFVSDARHAAMKIFSPEGDPLFFLGGTKGDISPLGFSMPTGVWLDADDKLYVADQLNRRFVIWQYFSQAYLERHPEDRPQ